MATSQNPTGPDDPKAQVPPVPEVVGATSAPTTLGKGVTQVSLEVHPPTGPALLRGAQLPRRVFLQFENITSPVRAPAFDVYLNLPPGEEPEKHPELQVGVLSMFGLPESSRSTDQHANNGLSYTQEVTGLYLRLTAMRTWDPKNLRVTFVPRRWDDDIQVKVGRVSLVFQ